MVLALLTIWLVALIMLLALSFGVGLLIHWLVPSIDLGMGTLIGLLALVASGRFLAWLTFDVRDGGEQGEADEEVLDHAEAPIIHIIGSPPWRRARRRKKARK